MVKLKIDHGNWVSLISQRRIVMTIWENSNQKIILLLIERATERFLEAYLIVNWTDRAQVMIRQEQASIDVAHNILMLPWRENMQEKLIKIEASRWVKMNMIRISKQLGMKSGETEDKLLKLLLRIDSAKPKESISSPLRITSPRKKCERVKKMLEFGIGFGSELSKRGRSREKEASSIA